MGWMEKGCFEWGFGEYVYSMQAPYNVRGKAPLMRVGWWGLLNQEVHMKARPFMLQCLTATAGPDTMHTIP